MAAETALKFRKTQSTIYMLCAKRLASGLSDGPRDFLL
jgi:hypothetical protein